MCGDVVEAWDAVQENNSTWEQITLVIDYLIPLCHPREQPEIWFNAELYKGGRVDRIREIKLELKV